jgi:hypothetical protein
MPTWTITAPDGTKMSIEAHSQLEALQKGKEQLANPQNSAAGMGKTAASSLVRGLGYVAGMPGDLMGLVDAGVRKAPKLLGYPEAQLPQERTAIGRATERFAPVPPTSQDVISSVEKNVTGPLYQPRTKAEKYLGTAMEFLPAAAAGPGRLAAMPFRQSVKQTTRRVVPTAVAPAIASETAGQLTEGTPYEGVARFAGALGPSALTATRRRPAMPSVSDMEMGKQQAYKVVDNLGTRYTPGAYGLLVSSIRNKAKQQGISPIRHANALSMIDDMEKTYPGMFAVPGSPTLTELDMLRQNVRDDLMGNKVDARFGEMIIDRIDAFVDIAGPMHTTSMQGSRIAADAMRKARAANTQWRKAELLEYELDKARRQAAVTGSGGNVENTVRQAVNRILNKPAQLRSFTAQEREIMRQIADPASTKQDMLRLAGKFSPAGNGLIAWLTVAASVGVDPLMAVPAAAGAAAKRASEAATQGRVNNLEQLVRTGGITPSPQSEAARQMAVTTMLQGPRSAGQQPQQSPFPYLRPPQTVP